jgi:replicative DNA helicase
MVQEAGCLDTALERLKAEDFWEPAHRRLFTLMAGLRREGKTVDYAVLATHLPVQWMPALGELSAQVTSVLVFSEMLRMVAEIGQLRRWQRAATEICVLTAGGGAGDAAEIVDRAEGLAFSAQMAQGSVTLRKSNEVAVSVIERMEKARERRLKGAGAVEITSGIPEIDLVSDGWHPKEMIVVAARPGQGKTAYGLQCARLNLLNGKRVGFITLEMTAEELMNRNLSARTGINLRKIRTGDLTDYELDLLAQHVEEQGQWPLFFEDVGALTATAFRSKARRLVSVHGVQLIIVDYLQLIEDKDEYNRTQAMATISRTVKSTAKELNIPILALAQLNRKTNDGDGRPQLHHLRESGSIEQDADNVVLISRMEKFDEEETLQVVQERVKRHEYATLFDLAKCRNGATGETLSLFEGRFQCFTGVQSNNQQMKPRKNSREEIMRNW